MENKFKKVSIELSERLSNLPYQNGDISDIGNEIGIIIAKYFDETDLGYDLDDFIHGVKHGVSITDGTHG